MLRPSQGVIFRPWNYKGIIKVIVKYVPLVMSVKEDAFCPRNLHFMWSPGYVPCPCITLTNWSLCFQRGTNWIYKYNLPTGTAVDTVDTMDQADSCRNLNFEVWVRSQLVLCEILLNEVAPAQVYLQYFGFPLSLPFHLCTQIQKH
jgi:hypothetical protein